MSTYVEFFERAQAEFLTSLKQAQELNLKTIAAVTDLVATAPTFTPKDASSVKFPLPTEIVERSFAFTNQLLETRKEYAIKLAELATEAQKQFTETTKRVAEAAKN